MCCLGSTESVFESGSSERSPVVSTNPSNSRATHAVSNLLNAI